MVIIMKTITNTLMEIYDGMSTVTKYAFRYGTVLILTLFTAAVYFFIRARTGADPFFSSMMFSDIMVCIKECMGSVYILPMLYETILMSFKR